MTNKPILTVAIPTYNRASLLGDLLKTVLPQANKLKDNIQVCISDNCSTDKTDEVVSDFKKKYPGLINYNKNSKNLDMDKNILKVMEMSNGDFIWLFSDDDLMAENALNEIVDFIKLNNKDDIGAIFVRTKSYLVDENGGGEIICNIGVDKTKPKVIPISSQEITSMAFPEVSFISAMIFNKELLFNVLEEDRGAVFSAVGIFNMHTILCGFIFIKNRQARAFLLNSRPMVLQKLSYYKLFIEDKFMAHYKLQRKINDSFSSYKYSDRSFAVVIKKRNKKARKEFIINMATMRAFENFNYKSYKNCLKTFFKNSPIFDALIFSFVFSLLFLIPPFVLKLFYKVFLMKKYKKNWVEKLDISNQIAFITSRSAPKNHHWID